MKTGFIGAGNMAGALVKGFVKAGFKSEYFFVFDLSKDKTSALRDECGVKIAASNDDILEKCDVIVLAVKPHLISGVLEEIKGRLDKSRHTLVSIAAGTSIDMIAGFSGIDDMPIIRVMPNVNVSILQGMCAVCKNKYVRDEVYDYVFRLLSGTGRGIELDESLFVIFGALAGSAPAFSYYFIESLARAAHKAGMPKEKALEIAAQTVGGSANMLLESGKHPWELIDTVCSPGGTTIEGICALDEFGFSTSVVKCIDACMDKDRKIMEKNTQ